jgi:hypothetical protein
MIWRFTTKVKSVTERTRDHFKGLDKDATIERTESLGWFLHLDGSWESLFLGFEEPGLKAGDDVEIVIRKQ